jgi:hypothetical protein
VVGAHLDCGWRCKFESLESTVDPIKTALSTSILDIYNTIVDSPGGLTMLPSKTKRPGATEANWDGDGDANLNRLKAPLILPRTHFQRVF